MPRTKKILIPDGGIIGIAKMIDPIDELEILYNSLWGKKMLPFNIKHERRKREWLASRILIAEMIGTDFSVFYKETGAPFIEHIDYNFISISHSKEYVAVYLHRNKKVGIDIEKTDRNFSFVEKKYLSKNELVMVAENMDLRAVFWSCKEAIYKWAGEEESVDFCRQIKIEKNDNEKKSVSACFIVEKNMEVKLNYSFFDGHVLAFTV